MAGERLASLSHLAIDALRWVAFGFVKAGASLIRRIVHHAADGGSHPLRAFAGGDVTFIELASDGTQAETLTSISIKNPAHHLGLGFDHLVIGLCGFAFLHIAIAVRGLGKYADGSLLGAMALAPTTTLSDLGPLVLGDHALKLHQELIFWSLGGGGLQKNQLYSIACELFSEQDLVSVFAAQTVRCVHQHGRDLALGRQVAHRFQARSRQGGATIAFVLKLP